MTHNVLVVDDEPTVREASTALLAGWGCQPATAPLRLGVSMTSAVPRLSRPHTTN